MKITNGKSDYLQKYKILISKMNNNHIS